jgi:mono/diheme cytochrome c family protein
MDHLTNAILGLVFVGVAVTASFLMFHLWGYPFDHTTHKSEAPRSMMLLHRVLGYIYAGIFIYLMAQMIPRLWTYEIEFPARTVAHLVIGLVIGITLITKIAIVRFFKHLESTLAPFLGTLLLICTVVLIGLSVPTAFLEALASGRDIYTPESVERVRGQFAQAGIPPGKLSAQDLRAGRKVLSSRCVACHDLRTVLARPRTASDWHATVTRMAERSVWLNPINDREQLQVTAYLVSISPELQVSVKERRAQEQLTETTRSATTQLEENAPASPGFDVAKARLLFENKCSQCHEAKLPDRATVKTPADVRALVTRMVDNGLSATPSELRQITRYLIQATPQ